MLSKRTNWRETTKYEREPKASEKLKESYWWIKTDWKEPQSRIHGEEVATVKGTRYPRCGQVW